MDECDTAQMGTSGFHSATAADLVEYGLMSRLLRMMAVVCVLSPSAMAATNAVLTTTAELRALSERLTYLRNLEEKKAQVLGSIEEQGKLTPELKKQIWGGHMSNPS